MLLKMCNKCGTPIPYGSPYCKDCTPIVEAEREARLQKYKRESNKRYNKTRDPKYTKFYNSMPWRVLSSKRLSDDNYKCCMCGRIATEVDHIIEIQTPEGWELRLDYDNTRSVCHDCHNKRHNRFKRKRPLKARKGY